MCEYRRENNLESEDKTKKWHGKNVIAPSQCTTREHNRPEYLFYQLGGYRPGERNELGVGWTDALARVGCARLREPRLATTAFDRASGSK